MSYGSILSQNPPDLPLTGGTMTGPLILSGDPTENLEAATKQYVDEAKASVLELVLNKNAGYSTNETLNFTKSVKNAKLLFFGIKANSSSSREGYISLGINNQGDFVSKQFGLSSGNGFSVVLINVGNGYFCSTDLTSDRLYVTNAIPLDTSVICYSPDLSCTIRAYAIF